MKQLSMLEQIEKEVFDTKKMTIPYLKSDNIPEGLNEETYILIQKKN